MNSSGEWRWVTEYGMYFSTTANLYAKPNPLTGQWEYQSAGETSAAGAANASKAFEEDRSVGWAMLGDRDDRDGGDDDKDVAIQRDQGSTAYNDPVAYAYPADATAGFLTHPKVIASSQVEVSAAVAPKTTQILRLVVVKSRILRDSERVAVIDSREDGFIIGRDKNHRPRIRLKEMEVSKVHATVFWGDGKGSLDDEEGDEGYWLVDNGSTHGTFLLDPQQTVDARRLSEPKRTSRPSRLHHLSRILIGSTTFECHLHPDWPCDDCAMRDGRMIDTEPDGAADQRDRTADGVVVAASSLHGDWKATEARRLALTSQAKKDDQDRRSKLAMRKLRESYLGEDDTRRNWKDGHRKRGPRPADDQRTMTARRRPPGADSKEASPATGRNTPDRPLDNTNKGYAMLRSMTGSTGDEGMMTAPMAVHAVDGKAGLGAKKTLGIADVMAKGDGSSDWRSEGKEKRWAEVAKGSA